MSIHRVLEIMEENREDIKEGLYLQVSSELLKMYKKRSIRLTQRKIIPGKMTRLDHYLLDTHMDPDFFICVGGKWKPRKFVMEKLLVQEKIKELSEKQTLSIEEEMILNMLV